MSLQINNGAEPAGKIYYNSESRELVVEANTTYTVKIINGSGMYNSNSEPLTRKVHYSETTPTDVEGEDGDFWVIPQ